MPTRDTHRKLVTEGQAVSWYIASITAGELNSTTQRSLEPVSPHLL